MSRLLNACTIALVLILPVACSNKPENTDKTPPGISRDSVALTNSPEATPYIVPEEDRTWALVPYDTLVARLPPFDFKQDLSGKTLEELRLLRNTIPARKGFLFMHADLRYYFYQTPWYRNIMEARWYGDCEYSGLKPAPPIAYTPEEQNFLDRVTKAENEKRKENFIVRDGLKYANVRNIVNAWQFGKLPPPLLQALDRNGLAIVPSKNVQLFHVYEQNDYSQTQNFVSTDLYLQLFHMHFSLMLRDLEENNFTSVLGDLTSGMVETTRRYATSETDAAIRSHLQFTEAFFAIPLTLLTGEKPAVSPALAETVNSEIKKINQQESALSGLLPAYKKVEFPYDLFKPRGHYTRTPKLQQYFRAMQWVQQGSYCLEDDEELKAALTAAFVLEKGSQGNRSLRSLYAAILEPTTFLIGKPDNLSILDLCELIRKRKVGTLKELLGANNVSAIKNELRVLAETKNVIKPKIENTCPDKINFMPARLVIDNEIIQTMTDLDHRPFPKGLDVMAAFGSESAEKILTEELGEHKKWDGFLPQLQAMKSKYKNYTAWDESVYSKWIQGLNQLLLPDKRYPSFMQLPSWSKKNLNTALASWAELKHDAILYAEQPMAAECGGGGECDPPPEPYQIGYVEPNVHYWKSALQLLELNTRVLNAHGLLENNDIRYRQAELAELCNFFLTVSEKELRGEPLLEQEYRTIEKIGSTVENVTLRIFGTDHWSHISGPDKEIAVVADIYTNNQGPKAGILHVAVGYAHELYVVVEVGGYLYLTKGATLSYYEFPRPLNDRLTDESWQDLLKENKAYPAEPWMDGIIIELDDSIKPQVVEYLYSSGC